MLNLSLQVFLLLINMKQISLWYLLFLNSFEKIVFVDENADFKR